jgi:hypothetical protein
MTKGISAKKVHEFVVKLFSTECVNIFREEDRKSFGSSIFNVSFKVEEQNEELAKSLVEDMIEKYPNTKKNPLIQIKEMEI